MFVPFWAWEAGGFLAGVRVSIWMRSLTFLDTDIEGSAAMAGRPGDAWATA
jgi:hypothetical protein